ncbi:MAG: FadR/GntR family transcriptional regulator [Acidimicrobiales bacterium]
MTASNTTERAATRVARRIVSDIQERDLRPGTRLEPEHVMVEKQGAARGTVREALRFLELHGTVKVQTGPHGGPVVSVPQIDHLVSALSLQLQFADATFRSILEARRSIYPVLVAEAAENATDEDIAALQASLDRLSEAVHDSDATTHEARQFYELVAVASKNLVLGLLVNALHQMSDAGIAYDLEQREASLKQSGRILKAIEGGDPDKARALSVKMHAAARRYWETSAPELLNTPVAWMTP